MNNPPTTRDMIWTPSDEEALKRGCYYDHEAAVKVERFFERVLRRTDEGHQGEEFKLLPWQREKIIRPLFGWRRADGRRRFTKAHIEIPKKNGKTGLCAGLTVYFLMVESDGRRQIFSAAKSREQAAMVFEDAKAFIEASELLEERAEIYETTKRIENVSSGEYYKSLSADADTQEGLRGRQVVFDELHIQANRKLWRSLRYSVRGAKEPLFIVITTAGEYRPDSIGWEQHERARKVMSGEIVDVSFYGLIYAVPEKADWTDPEEWKKANPSLGHLFTMEQMQEDFEEAKVSAAAESEFRRYLLNQWVKSARAVPWVDLWPKCQAEPPDLAGRRCVAGLDLAYAHDFSAFVVVWEGQPDAGVPHYVRGWFWLNDDEFRERIRSGQVPISMWTRAGHLTVTEGNATDYPAIEQKILELAREHAIQEIAFDRFSAQQMAQRLEAEGLVMVEIPQTTKQLGPAVVELERLVKTAGIQHDGNPVMTWHVSNAHLYEKVDGVKFVKETKDSSFAIDGAAALSMAMARIGASQTKNTVVMSSVF